MVCLSREAEDREALESMELGDKAEAQEGGGFCLAPIRKSPSTGRSIPSDQAGAAGGAAVPFAWLHQWSMAQEPSMSMAGVDLVALAPKEGFESIAQIVSPSGD